MNVLIVSPKFHPIIGGGETYVLNLAGRLHEAGLQVSVAAEPHAERNAADYPYDVYEVDGLSDCELHIINATANMYGLIKSLKPDIIHVHGYFALLAVGLANPDSIPVIASVHSTPVWGERIIGGMDNFDAELNFARSVIDAANPELMIAANNVYADAALRVVGERTLGVEVLPYPVDIDYFYEQHDRSMRKELGIADDEILILTPSRIIERKGIKEIVNALAELPDNYHLCLPGAYEPLDSKYWDSVCSSAEYKKAKDRIVIPSRRMLYDDMPLLYAASDIIAMPSYYEGAPVATVEAMASGKPFVGADSQGINGFIRHGENGLLVPKRSVGPLAHAVRQLAADETLRCRLSAQAKRDVAPLSWEAQLPVTIAIYQKILMTEEQTDPSYDLLLQP